MQNAADSRPKRPILLFIWRHLPRVALTGFILLIIVLILLIAGKKSQLEEEKAAARSPEAKPVNAVLLELEPTVIKDAINLPGVIEPWTRLELMAKVGGSVEEVMVEEGDTVQDGQVLARIEEADYRIALDSARAAFEQARADYERGKLMLARKAIPEAELELSQSRMLTARAAMQDAELQLSRCTITAPISGVIHRLDADVGLLLSNGDPVAEILQIDRVKAVVGIPESDVAAVRTLPEVQVTIRALGDRKITGRRHFLAPAPESTARLYRLELALDNPDREILPGMFLRAHVIKRMDPEALALPLYSIISRNSEQFVYVAGDDGVVRKQPVRLGIIENWLVQVTDGLEPGDRVVIEGHRDVEEGQRINVVRVITDPGEFLL